MKCTLLPIALLLLYAGAITATDASRDDIAPSNQAMIALSDERSVAEFVDSAGRFDLEAARRSGFEGSLNLDGFKSAVDPTTGEPLFRASGAAQPSDDPDDVYWDNSISPSESVGLDGSVKALSVYDGRLIAAGYFTWTGATLANAIAAWDGTTWHPMGTGFDQDGGPDHLAVYYDTLRSDTLLVVSGEFGSVGGVHANSVAFWNGIEWDSLGRGLRVTDDTPFPYAWGGDMIAYDTCLFIDGYFDSVGDLSGHAPAKWDGAKWYSLTNDYTGLLTVHNGILIGSQFVGIYPEERVNVVSWNGSSWDSLTTVPGGVSRALTYDGGLIVAGDFDSVDGGVAARHIASWDGSGWHALGGGLNGFANSLVVYDGKLIVGGSFSEVDGKRIYNVASWDGSSWSPLGSGTDEGVTAMAVYNDTLIVGGYFTSAGGKPAAYLARWTKHDGCCSGRVGDADGSGDDEPSIGDVSVMVDAAYITGSCIAEGAGANVRCIIEADINQSGGANPTCDDISIGDVSILIDYLFITGPLVGLPNCM